MLWVLIAVFSLSSVVAFLACSSVLVVGKVMKIVAVSKSKGVSALSVSGLQFRSPSGSLVLMVFQRF